MQNVWMRIWRLVRKKTISVPSLAALGTFFIVMAYQAPALGVLRRGVPPAYFDSGDRPALYAVGVALLVAAIMIAMRRDQI